MILDRTSAYRQTARPSYFVTRQAHGLRKILERGVNAGVWRRTFAPDQQLWLDGLARSTTFELTTAVRVGSTKPSVLPALPPCAELRAWNHDIGQVITMFAALAGVPRMAVSLTTVTTDKCRKFHADYKALRLVCTYSGPGTEWVEDRDVVRAEMGRQESSFDVANARIVPTARRIQRAGPGDVLLLKGELFPQNRGHGAVHRSPPIEQTTGRRLVLTIDTE